MSNTKLNLKIINELVEFRTSIGIITSVLAGTGYSFYINKSINIYLLISVLISSILLDGAATVFNHYYDFKKAKFREGYLYNTHNPIVAYNLTPFTAFFVGAALIGLAGLLGLYIILSTSWILLPVGVLSILIAYFYSAGKKPISYGPFGELVSGFFEGCIVFGISYFVQSGNYSPDVFLASLPIAIGISNIMLANNTSDVEEDRKNGRRTLPIVIGQENGVRLLYFTHTFIYLLNTIYYFWGKMPIYINITLLMIPFTFNNLRMFSKNRTKSKGFIYVLRNTILYNLLVIISLFISSLAK